MRRLPRPPRGAPGRAGLTPGTTCPVGAAAFPGPDGPAGPGEHLRPGPAFPASSAGLYHAVVIDAHHHLWDLAAREHR